MVSEYRNTNRSSAGSKKLKIGAYLVFPKIAARLWLIGSLAHHQTAQNRGRLLFPA
jgi:hypothetical protein